MAGHIVGWDPFTGRVVILRGGADGKAARQVEALELHEADRLANALRDIVRAWRKGQEVKVIRQEPEPEQVPLEGVEWEIGEGR